MLETALLILALCGGAYLLLRLTRASPRAREAQWEERVLLLTRGNRGAMERAVTARKKRFPNATRAELLKMVYEDYLRDRE